MRERGIDACVMEVSSHALALHRVDGVVYDVALFTNLSQDHLDFHASMDDYFGAKASLFTPAALARGGRVRRRRLGSPPRGRGHRADDDARHDGRRADGTDDADWVAEAAGQGDAGDAGAFTLARALDRPGAAPRLAPARPLQRRQHRARRPGAPATSGSRRPRSRPRCPWPPTCRAGWRSSHPADPEGPRCVVDFAHTPDAVDAALAALRGSTAGRLIAVLGAGGDRDRGKRPAMGAAAARRADVVVVTDDNPRSEDPAEIRSAVIAGAREAVRDGAAPVTEIIDGGPRSSAIAEAIALAVVGTGEDRPVDTVVVLGKGHEKGQEIHGVKHPFDDRDAVRAALAAVSSSGVTP